MVYTGDEGSLAHIAATKFVKSDTSAILKGVDSFHACFEEVASGRSMYGVIPIENSNSGALVRTYDLIVQHDVVIAGELGVREIYCLCVKNEATSLGDIRRILSHTNIIHACSTFVDERLTPAARKLAGKAFTCELRPTRSTTEAAKLVAEASPDVPAGIAAAIATKEAAAKHNLVILADDIGNDALVETRYVLIHTRTGRAAQMPPPIPRDWMNPMRKRSACFVLRNEAGAMLKLMDCFAHRDIPLLKIETRPLHSGARSPPGLPPGGARLWDHVMFVDYGVPTGQTAESDGRLQASLKEFSMWHRDYGAYNSYITYGVKQAQKWDDMIDIMTKA